ncbi:hypothetical protein [Kaarinaea lacus]
MKFVSGVDQSKRIQSVMVSNESSMLKKIATGCFMLSLGVAIFGSQQALAEQDNRLGGYTLEDESMLGRYGDVNDEWVEVSNVSISKSQMSVEKKRKMPKSDNRLGAYSMQDDAMLGRYGDKDDEL